MSNVKSHWVFVQAGPLLSLVIPAHSSPLAGSVLI
jgi:hypothetical protein